MSMIIKTAILESQKRDAETAAQYAAEFQQVRNSLRLETEDRTAADNTLQNNLNTETQNRIDADNTLQNKLNVETQNRIDADNTLQNNLNTETQNRIDADNTLQNNLNTETQNRHSAISDAKDELQAALSNVEAFQNAENDNIRDEIQEKDAAQNLALQALRGQLQNAKNNHDNDISNLRAGYTAADETLQQNIESEISNRKNAITALETSLTNSFTSGLNTEKNNRIAALNDLESALLAALGNNQAAQNIQNENLRAQIETSTTLSNAAIQALSARHDRELIAISNLIAGNTSAISNEISARQNAITNLNGALSTSINEKATETLADARTYTDQKFNGVASSLNEFTAPTATQNGKSGLVPAPPAGTDLKLLTTQGWRTIDSAELVVTTVPSQSNYLEYNKSSQSPTWANFDTSKLSLSGTTSGTSAGNYTAYFTPTGLYVWSDTKDQSARAVTWTINKLYLAKPAAAVTSFAADGTTHTLQVANYDSNYITRSGAYSASAAGNYTAGYSLKSTTNTCWIDGTVAKVNIDWSISQESLTYEQSSGFEQVIKDSSYNGKIYPEYSGSAITPVIANFNSSIHQMTGDTSKINANYGSQTYSPYKVYISPKAGLTWYDGSTTPVEVEWFIQLKEISSPTIASGSFQYDGTVKTLQIENFDSAASTQSGTASATAVGDYSVTFKLKDKTNTCWQGGISYAGGDYTSDITYYWVINSSALKKPTLANSSYDYTGDAITPEINYFDSATMTKSGATSKTAAGNYTITISLKNTSSNTWADSSTDPITLNWTINPLLLTKPTLNTTSYTYNGTERTPTVKNLDTNYMSTTGTASAVNAGDYQITVKLRNTTNTKWADSSTANVTLDWTINKSGVANPNIKSGETYTYNGAEITASLVRFDPDSTKYTVTNYKATNAGTYTITVSLTDKNNYYWLYSEYGVQGKSIDYSFDWTINPITVTKPTIKNNGEVEANIIIRENTTTETYASVKNCIENFDSTTMTLSGDTSKKDLGTYNATIALKDPTNYIFDDGTNTSFAFQWTLVRKKLDAAYSANFVQDIEIVYDGKIHYWYKSCSAAMALNAISLTIGGVTATDEVCAGNAGTVTFNLAPAHNLCWADGTVTPHSYTMTIQPAKIQKPSLAVTSYEYDGTAKTPALLNYDSTTSTISSTSEQSATTAGTHTITITPKSNYCWNDSTSSAVTLSFTILKKTIARPTASTTYFVQDGGTKSLTLSNYNSSLMTQSGKVSASAVGTYTATFTLKDSTNYQFEGTTEKSVSINWEIGGVSIPIPTLQVNEANYSDADDSLTWFVYLQNFNSNFMSYSVSVTPTTKTNSNFSFKCTPVNGTDNILYKLFNNTQTAGNGNAKTVTATFSLTDKTNYKWADNTTSDKTVNFTLPYYKITGAFENLVQDIELVYNGTSRHWWEAFSVFGGLNFSNLNVNARYYGIDDLSKKDVGTYTAKIKPYSGCSWSDGSFTQKNVTWTIDKAAPAFSVEVNGTTYNCSDEAVVIQGEEFNLSPKILSRVYTPATDSDGNLTVTSKFVSGSSASSYLTVNKKNGIVTLTRTNGVGNEGAGDETDKLSVTIYFAAGTNYKISKKFTVLFNTYISLENYSWTQIQTMIQNNTLADNVDIGDKKSIYLNGAFYTYQNTAEKRTFSNEKVYAVLLGINHNSAVEGSRTAHFAVVKNITVSGGVNYWHVLTPPDSSTIGTTGFVDRSLYTYTNLQNNYGVFYNLLQDGTQDFITNCKKYIGTNYQSRQIWQLSYYEIYGNKPTGYSESTNYQRQYEYFANGNTVLAANFSGNSGGNVPVWSRSCDGASTYLGVLSNTPSAMSVGTIAGYIPCFAVA